LTFHFRAHDGATVMVFDERYVPLLRQANLLAITEIIHRGMPVFNAMTITTTVDRWRPETNSFHLPCGEMTVTLEDMAMILGLPIRGRPATSRVDSVGWCERVAIFVGREPPVRVLGVKGREARVRVSWLREEFHECPPNANEATVIMYTRAWVWHMFATVLFLDSTGDATSWIYISALAHWHEVGSYSWGSAVLAYLYRQLCDAFRRRGKTSGLGGCVYLLHVSVTTSIYFSLHLLSSTDDTCYLYLFCRFGWRCGFQWVGPDVTYLESGLRQTRKTGDPLQVTSGMWSPRLTQHKNVRTLSTSMSWMPSCLPL
jgi:hypothetical protein